MNFNTQQPMTPQQMAALYANGSPNLSSQAGGYISDQASAMGITGGVDNFFAQRRADQYNLAAGAQQRQMETARNTSAPVAGLQDSLYPLPTQGAPVNLRPLDQQEATRLGQSPEAYVLNRRLRAAGISNQMVPDLTSVGAQGSNVSRVGSGGISAEDLYNEPTFQAAMNRAPDKAHAVFQALTGQPLFGQGGFHDAYQGRRVAEIKQGTADLHEALQSGAARPTANGVEFAEKIFDPLTNKMTPTGKFTAGDPYQKSLVKYLPNVSSSISEFQRLEAKGGAPSLPVSALAGLQTPDSGAPNFMQTDPSGNYDTSQNVVEGTMGDIGRLFTGRMDQMAAVAGQEHPYGTGDFSSPQGHAAIHARSALASNPHFQELMRTDPVRARRLILAIQQGR